MPFLDLPGARIHYILDHAKQKPVLVLSHGLGMNLSLWDAQVDDFSTHFNLLRYDQRGHGRSSTPPGPYTIAQMGRDLLALLDALGIRQCHFCGLSMGGSVGQWLGAHAGERLLKLVLSNTAAKIGVNEGWNARIRQVREAGIESIAPSVVGRWFTPHFQATVPEAVTRARAMLLGADPEGYTAACEAIRDADQREDVRRIEVPTLIIAGSSDQAATPADGRHLAATIAGAAYLELEAAHLANVELAGRFNLAVQHFLTS